VVRIIKVERCEHGKCPYRTTEEAGFGGVEWEFCQKYKKEIYKKIMDNGFPNFCELECYS
jgi:hypothetical protein